MKILATHLCADVREAARLLRTCASNATPGPWGAAPDGMVWNDAVGDAVTGPVLREDAVYIALMNPLVGLTLAELLEFEVRHADSCGIRPHPTVLALARAVLRRTEVRS